MSTFSFLQVNSVFFGSILRDQFFVCFKLFLEVSGYSILLDIQMFI